LNTHVASVRGSKRRSSRAVVALLVAATVLLSGCLVNQRDLWAADKLRPDAPTSRPVSISNLPYGNDPLQTLDVYRPTTTPRGVILWFHPGGWCCGDKATVDPLVLATIDRGYVVVSANYRLAPAATAEQIVSDADRAVRFVKFQRGAWGVAGGKLIVAGGSAGGTLALLLGSAPGRFAASDLGPLAGVDPTVDAVVSLVGPSDLRPYIGAEIGGMGPGIVELFLGCSNLGSTWPATGSTPVSSTTTSTTLAPVPMPPCDPARVLRFSPLFWTALAVLFGGDLPPAYLAYGDQDGLVPPDSQGVVLHDWWSAGGSWLETYLDRPPAGGHNLSFDVNATAFSLWLGLFGSP